MHIDALYRFPVKSLLGEQVEQARLTGRGLLGDRAYALVDPADGTVASAKHPRKWGALLGLSKVAALELAPEIRVNTVVPGYTETPLVRAISGDPEDRAAIVSRIPLGRPGTPAGGTRSPSAVSATPTNQWPITNR